jgi:pseudouridine-5'-phosphate glycosidase
VPVIGYQTSELPAFYSRQSNLPVDVRVETAQEIVEIMRVRTELAFSGGLLVTVPVPAEDEWPAVEAQQVINQALADATTAGISGKAVTPYLLSRVSQLSSGRSKQANRALLLNNARVAAEIATAL